MFFPHLGPISLQLAWLLSGFASVPMAASQSVDPSVPDPSLIVTFKQAERTGAIVCFLELLQQQNPLTVILHVSRRSWELQAS